MSPTIYTIHWKPYQWAEDHGAIRHFVAGRDDKSGDNVADQNAHSELRVHYWVWRNAKPSGPIGIHHYRRAFLYLPAVAGPLAPFADLAEAACRRPFEQYTQVPDGRFLDYRKALGAIEDWGFLPDVIVPRPLDLTRQGDSLGGQYCLAHRRRDWAVFEALARAEGLDLDLPFLHCFNMFVMQPALFDDYMALWHRVMSAAAERIELPTHGYQSRVFAFLSERLFTCWLYRLRLERPRLRIDTAPVLYAPHHEGGPGIALVAQSA